MSLQLLQATLLAEITLDANREPPREFRVFKRGMNESSKGNFLFSDSSADDVMDAYREHGVDLSIDYAHGMFAGGLFGSPDPGQSGKAAGWFKPEVRAGALWATNVEWTPAAKSMLQNREYRYISPAFQHSDDGTICELRNCALTNIPALKNAPPVVAHSQPTPEAPKEVAQMKSLLAILSLPEGSSEEKGAAALLAVISDRAALMSATSATTVSEALGKVEGWKAAAAQHTELSKKFAELEVTSKKASLASMLDAAVKEGKVAPAELELLTSMGEADPKKLEAYLSVKPKVIAIPAVAPGTGTTTGAGNVATLSDAEREVARQMGTDPAKLAASMAKYGSVIPVIVTQESQTSGVNAQVVSK